MSNRYRLRRARVVTWLGAAILADRPIQQVAGWGAHGHSMPLLRRKIRHHKHTRCRSGGRPEGNLDGLGSPGDVFEVLCVWMRDLCRPKQCDEEFGAGSERLQIPGGQQQIRREPRLTYVVEKLIELVLATRAETDYRSTVAREMGS